MVYFNNNIEPTLFSKRRGLIAQNQCYSYHNILFDYIDKLEKNNESVLSHLSKLDRKTTTNSKYNNLILKIINDIKKEQLTQNKKNRIAFEEVQQKQVKMNIDFNNSHNKIFLILKEINDSKKNTDLQIQQLNLKISSHQKELIDTILSNGKSIVQEMEKLSITIDDLKQYQNKNTEDIMIRLRSILNNHEERIVNIYEKVNQMDGIINDIKSIQINQIKRDEFKLEQFLLAVKQLGEIQTKQLQKVREKLHSVDENQKEQFKQYLYEIQKLDEVQNIELEKVKNLLYDLDETQKEQLEKYIFEVNNIGIKVNDMLHKTSEIQKEQIDNYTTEVNKFVNAHEEAEIRRSNEQERINAQLENITSLQNEALKLLKTSQLAMVKLLRNLSVGKSVNSITVRGQQILVKEFINYDNETDLVSFIKADEDIIIVNAYHIMAISFPTD